MFVIALAAASVLAILRARRRTEIDAVPAAIVDRDVTVHRVDGAPVSSTRRIARGSGSIEPMTVELHRVRTPITPPVGIVTEISGATSR